MVKVIIGNSIIILNNIIRLTDDYSCCFRGTTEEKRFFRQRQ